MHTSATGTAADILLRDATSGTEHHQFHNLNTYPCGSPNGLGDNSDHHLAHELRTPQRANLRNASSGGFLSICSEGALGRGLVMDSSDQINNGAFLPPSLPPAPVLSSSNLVGGPIISTPSGQNLGMLASSGGIGTNKRGTTPSVASSAPRYYCFPRTPSPLYQFQTDSMQQQQHQQHHHHLSSTTNHSTSSSFMHDRLSLPLVPPPPHQDSILESSLRNEDYGLVCTPVMRMGGNTHHHTNGMTPRNPQIGGGVMTSPLMIMSSMNMHASSSETIGCANNNIPNEPAVPLDLDPDAVLRHWIVKQLYLNPQAINAIHQGPYAHLLPELFKRVAEMQHQQQMHHAFDMHGTASMVGGGAVASLDFSTMINPTNTNTNSSNNNSNHSNNNINGGSNGTNNNSANNSSNNNNPIKHYSSTAERLSSAGWQAELSNNNNNNFNSVDVASVFSQRRPSALMSDFVPHHSPLPSPLHSQGCPVIPPLFNNNINNSIVTPKSNTGGGGGMAQTALSTGRTFGNPHSMLDHHHQHLSPHDEDCISSSPLMDGFICHTPLSSSRLDTLPPPPMLFNAAGNTKLSLTPNQQHNMNSSIHRQSHHHHHHHQQQMYAIQHQPLTTSHQHQHQHLSIRGSTPFPQVHSTPPSPSTELDPPEQPCEDVISSVLNHVSKTAVQDENLHPHPQQQQSAPSLALSSVAQLPPPIPNGVLRNPSLAATLLEEYRQDKHPFELADVEMCLIDFAQDQFGSRLIQSKLDSATDKEKDLIFQVINAEAALLTTDVFGNYVVQKFLEVASVDQRAAVAAHLKGRVLEMSLHMYGCRVVQKTLETTSLETQLEIVSELKNEVIRCVEDQNGNHVIQKCIEFMPCERVLFVIDAFFTRVPVMAVHVYGCRVLQRLLEHCNSNQVASLVKEALACVGVLITDQYGNYVVQHIIEHGQPDDKSIVLSLLTSQIQTLASHKFASNVVEKALVMGTPDIRASVMISILDVHEAALAQNPTNLMDTPIACLAKDRFGNYVIQRMLELSEGTVRQRLIVALKELSPLLRKFSFAKHISVALEKIIRAEAAVSTASHKMKSASNNGRRNSNTSFNGDNHLVASSQQQQQQNRRNSITSSSAGAKVGRRPFTTHTNSVKQAEANNRTSSFLNANPHEKDNSNGRRKNEGNGIVGSTPSSPSSYVDLSQQNQQNYQSTHHRISNHSSSNNEHDGFISVGGYSIKKKSPPLAVTASTTTSSEVTDVPKSNNNKNSLSMSAFGANLGAPAGKYRIPPGSVWN